MTDREKLIELIGRVQDKGVSCVDCFSDTDKPDYIGNFELADYPIANGVTVQQWISVEDETPKGDCLVYDANGGKVRCGSGTEILAAADWHITHWMPMPTPPKEG